jgi:hypothetical protein
VTVPLGPGLGSLSRPPGIDVVAIVCIEFAFVEGVCRGGFS